MLTKERVSVPVSFVTAPLVSLSTRAIDPATISDSDIANLWVVQFDQTGVFMQKNYLSTVDAANVKVDLAPNAIGSKSNIYFIANIGATFNDPTNETEFLKLTRNITSEDDLFTEGAAGKKNVFLVGSLKDFSVVLSGYMPKQIIMMERMVSKVVVKYAISADVANFITIESARLCNVPKTMAYFPPKSDVASTNTAETFSYPIQELTPGSTGTLTFYIPDNQRGEVTNTADKPHLKSGVEGATYIELMGHTIGAQGGDAITYRVY